MSKIKDKINLQIGGEIGQYNSLPIDYLVEISKNLQNLLQTIAKVSISDGSTLDLNNFKVELTGFNIGSAVPEFAFTQRIQTTAIGDVFKQREIVKQQFEDLLTVSDSGNYDKIRQIYPEAYRRNEVVESLYGFTKSFGSSPVNVVDIKQENGKSKIIPLYKVRKFSKEIKDSLTVNIIENKEPEIYEDISIRKVKTVTKNGHKSSKILEEYSDKKASLSYAPDVITYEESIYELICPLRCSLEKEDDYYLITCELLDIVGSGLTPDLAEESFAQEFDYIHKRYNELGDSKLTKRLQAIKTILNIIVKK